MLSGKPKEVRERKPIRMGGIILSSDPRSILSVLTKILTEFAKKCYILELKLILTIQSKFSLLELIFY